MKSSCLLIAWWESREGTEEAGAAARAFSQASYPAQNRHWQKIQREAVSGSQGLISPLSSCLLRNNTCPAALCFPMDITGFEVDLGTKIKLPLRSLACSLNQAPERCSFEDSNGYLTFFQRYLLQSLGTYIKAWQWLHRHCLLKKGMLAQPSQSVPPLPGDSQLQILGEHRALPPTATYSTHRHILLLLVRAPLGAPPPQ